MSDFKKIGEGNEATHGSNTIADASLYTSDKRYDEEVLIDFYRLISLQISLLV